MGVKHVMTDFKFSGTQQAKPRVCLSAWLTLTLKSFPSLFSTCHFFKLDSGLCLNVMYKCLSQYFTMPNTTNIKQSHIC